MSSTLIFETSGKPSGASCLPTCAHGGCYATATAVASASIALASAYVLSLSRQNLKRQGDLEATLKRPCVGCHATS